MSVPVTETVARYRIGFRGEDGRVIAHVDKRQQASGRGELVNAMIQRITPARSPVSDA